MIRPATAEDVAAVAEVHVRAWRAAYAGLLSEKTLADRPVELRREQWSQWYSPSPPAPSFHLVAERDGRVFGFCSVATPAADAAAGPDVAEIAALYVEPALWRRGVGSELLEAALGRLREEGWRSVILWVFERNEPARAFYATAGFRPDGGRQARFDDAPEVRLRLDLR